MNPKCVRLVCLIALLTLAPSLRAEEPSLAQAESALKKAVSFYREKVARHGGYVWRYSGDLTLSEGEAKTGPTTVWVQPPGTPTVGMAFLDAFEATHDPAYRDAAREAAQALVLGQKHSGGWSYSIEFDPALRSKESYRLDLDGHLTPDPVKKADRALAAGWLDWKHRTYRGNITTLDDNTTQAATRFLVRADRVLGFQDKPIHDAALFALDALCRAQYPIGGWSANFDRFPTVSPSAEVYPVKPASFPAEWSRTWPKTFTGCYVTNDNLMSDMLDVLLEAETTYQDVRYRAAAERAGRFLILAQMPDPQPAWAQQYDKDMQPDWSRKFEPPAITGSESQSIMLALIALARHTVKAEYLEPVPKALAYLKKSALPDGRLARFYELKTNKPLYFTRDYQITYDGRDVPRHYGFVVPAKFDQIQREYDRARTSLGQKPAPRRPKPSAGLSQRAAAVIAALDDRGAWVERRVTLDAHDVKPESGVIASSTFAANVKVLCDFIQAARGNASAP